MSASELNVVYSRITFEKKKKQKHWDIIHCGKYCVRHSNGGFREVAQDVKALSTKLTA